MNELTKIGNKHGVGKKAGRFVYTERVYYPILENIRYEKLNLLELGVGDTGASVKMWKDFLPNSNIYLFDPFFIVDESVTVTPEELEEYGINVIKGNQLRTEDLLKIAEEQKKFDIIIDDASHISDGIQLSLAVLFPFLKPGGKYVVEDIHSAWDRDARLDGVNSWLDGPVVDQSIEKVYHRKEINLMDALISLQETGKWASNFLTEEQKEYLVSNIQKAEFVVDDNVQPNVVVLTKKGLKR